MFQLIGWKALSLVLVLLAVSLLTFLMQSLLPGCVECQILGPDNMTRENVARVRDDLDLDEPLHRRYASWLGEAVTGDLGRSYNTRQPVDEAIVERLPVTAEIVALSMVMALAIAIPLGLLTAYRAGGALDRVVTGATFGMLAVPSFMMALLLIYMLAVELGWLPATGWTHLTDDPVENLRSAFMPSLSLALVNVAVLTRLLRSDVIATLQEDFVLMARSKGLPTRRILTRHVLRPSSLSLLTVSGLTIGNLIGGAVIVEQLFALPGVGRLLFDSIGRRDLLVVQGVVLVVATAFVVVNGLVDILYSVLDPRIRTRSAT
jgi:peptide/nickel transport system permease protein